MTIPELNDATLDYVNAVFNTVNNGDANGVLKLIQQQTSVNLTNANADSLLTVACERNHEDVVRVLLEKGANPHITNQQDQSPLMIAAIKGHATIAKLLLDHGAAVDVQDELGRTPLMLAAMSNHTDVMEVLLNDGADIHHVDAEGNNVMAHVKNANAAESLAWLELYIAGEDKEFSELI